MPSASVRGLACALLLALGTVIQAQTTATHAPAESESDERAQQTTPDSTAGQEASPDSTNETPSTSSSTLLDRFRAMLSQKEDPDGPIDTDRPTFTPAHTVIPPGRVQIESGWTYNHQKGAARTDDLYDFPELSFRYGLLDRVELRTLWVGPTFDEESAASRRARRGIGGASDMEVGIKWQLIAGDKERKWIPTTALITSAIAPTGGSSSLSSGVAEPYINLIYGWHPNDKLALCGSTGYLGQRQQAVAGSGLPADGFQRYHQSLVAFYSVGERTTVFYEWYVLMFTNAPNNLPAHFMDGGLLYRLTPNIQVDVRAGFGLSGRPDDFFTGTGFSFRF